MKWFALLVTLLLFNSAVWGVVDVQVVDSPSSVLRYSPILVTARVQNLGSEPVLIPATDNTVSRYFVEIGRSEGSLWELQMPLSDGSSGAVVWLKPGESWLFQVDVGPWIPESGTHVIRAGLVSTGKCQYRATGKEAFPLKAVAKGPGYEAYECWTGREVSGIRSIDIREPESAVDRDALAFVRSSEFPVDCCLEGRFYLRLQFGAASLLQRFPNSHYAYVGGFYAAEKSPDSLQRLIDLQPAHPLTPYTRFRSALALIRSDPKKLSPEQVSSLDIPAALKEYLLQELGVAGQDGKPVK